MLSSSTERGATAVTVAFAMVLILGMAAIAIDAAAGFVERRGDQSAVDVGTVAGALEVVVGTSAGSVKPADIVAASLNSIRVNLPTDYSSPAEWQALWEGCIDPASERNTEPGDNFVALSPPAAWGWVVADPANWCVSVDAAKSLYRVRTPDQLVETTFGNVIGLGSLSTQASAVADIIPGGGGDILPFGFPSGAADGVQQCLSDGPTGLAGDPCDGPQSGDFGTLKIRRFTPSPYNGCQVAPLNSVLALNIAAGIDHIVVPDLDGLAANEVRDVCYNFLVDTLQTDPGFPSGTESGIATGSGLPAGETARLKQGPPPKRNVVGHQLDDRPLWRWLATNYVVTVDPMVTAPIDYGGRTTPGVNGDDAPLFCDPDSFSGTYDFDGNPLTPPVNQFDFDGDGNPDPLASWQHMGRCLRDYAIGSLDPFAGPPDPNKTFVVILKPSLGDKDGDWSPRLAYVPQFHEAALGPGWRHVLRFRAVFIEGTWWKKGNNWVVHYPGESCSCGGNNYALKQVSAWIIPDGALPEELRGDPPSNFITPYTVELVR